MRKFSIRKALAEPEPGYNISPGQDVAIVTQGEKKLAACRWGFIPAWTRTDAPSGRTMINARAETLTEKSAFREAFLKRRCLVVADGFFEWEKTGKGRLPFYIRLRSGLPFGFAGLYNIRSSSEGDVCSCTVITTGANDLCAKVHNRMPAIIPADKEDIWLDPSVRDPDVLLGLLRPYPAREMEMYPVSPDVNSPKCDSPDLLRPVSK